MRKASAFLFCVDTDFLPIYNEHVRGENAPKDFKNFTISGNHMWYAGYGLCSQRKDKGHDAHIKSWTSANENKGNKNGGRWYCYFEN